MYALVYALISNPWAAAAPGRPVWSRRVDRFLGLLRTLLLLLLVLLSMLWLPLLGVR